jgi:protein-S-isoprenylcysteine O-methyltransferase Ste14
VLIIGLFWLGWLTVLLSTFMVSPFEERDLIGSFGERYRQYRAYTPMLLPFTKR